MFLRKTVLLFVPLLISVCIVSGQHPALSKIDTKDLKEYLSFIASDELQGRKLGTEIDGLGITADYLVQNAKRIGLQPGTNGFFQNVPMVLKKANADNFIEVLDKKGESIYQTNSVLIMNGVPGKFVAKNEEFVLGGFGEGLTKEQVQGKILVIGPGSGEDVISDNYGYSFRAEMRKIENLATLNPKIIIAVSDLKDKEHKAFKSLNRYFGRERYTVKSGEQDSEVPVIIVTPEIADAWSGGEGKYLSYLKKEATKSSTKIISVKKKRLNIELEILKDKIGAKNIIGMVEGSDPVLKNEYVVFMAHYDHLGIGKDGDVYNGADDNGSGTVAILEVAEAFASLETKPKRSIVFLWVTCEEIGHIGSTFYCDNPIFPLEKTVASINLDMVGRVYDGPRDDVWKKSPKKVKDFAGLYTLSNDVWPELAAINEAKCKVLGIVPDTSLPKSRFLRASDHYHFHKNGVPILNYATGYHADYHKVGDEVEKINFDKIKLVADLCFLLGLEVANTENIEFIKPEE